MAPSRAAITLLALALLIGVFGYLNQHPRRFAFSDLVGDFYANAVSEFVGIAITVLVIDHLYQRREIQRERNALILQMGSPDNASAIEAVRMLRARGWLTDGSLRKAYLRHANLSGADLQYANLANTDLCDADLSHAQLSGADLSNTDLQGANLCGTYMRTDPVFRGDHIVGSVPPANLNGARLRWAEFDRSTHWPEGFTPPIEAIQADTI